MVEEEATPAPPATSLTCSLDDDVAVSQCVECNECYCEMHAGAHVKAKATSLHTLVLLEQASTPAARDDGLGGKRDEGGVASQFNVCQFNANMSKEEKR